jgi:16S rRNA (guanine527-N7)-methyltransferase
MAIANPSPLPQLPEASDLWQQTLNWQPSPAQQTAYQQLYEAILRGNQQLNLTRITEPAEFLEKHLWDSLRGIKSWLELPLHPLRVIDVGTGGGFPGLPIAIACSDWQVTLLDSTHKKIAFIETVLASLNLSAQTLVDRAEQVGRLPQHRETYDLALIRAVATASVCAEYTLPLLKLGGMAVLYRGQWLEEETMALEAAAQHLGGRISRIESFTTPLSQNLRHCIHLEKIQPTRPQFPRAIGVPAQKPL